MSHTSIVQYCTFCSQKIAAAQFWSGEWACSECLAEASPTLELFLRDHPSYEDVLDESNASFWQYCCWFYFPLLGLLLGLAIAALALSYPVLGRFDFHWIPVVSLLPLIGVATICVDLATGTHQFHEQMRSVSLSQGVVGVVTRSRTIKVAFDQVEWCLGRVRNSRDILLIRDSPAVLGTCKWRGGAIRFAIARDEISRNHFLAMCKASGIALH